MIKRLLRKLHESRVFARGIVEVDLLGHRLRFVAESRRELQRLESFDAESNFVSAMLGVIRPGDVVWDVGANIGLISLVIAKLEQVTVHAFEPEARNFEHLQRNIALNGLEDCVFPHRLALGNREGEISFHVLGEVGDGRHSILEHAHRRASVVRVPIATAARFASENGGPPSVAKIDVEGAELDVAAGLEPLLKEKRVRALCVEVHPRQLLQQGHAQNAFVKIMASHGYVESYTTGRNDEEHKIFVSGE